MTELTALEVVRGGLFLAMISVTVLVLPSLIIGLAVSMLQAATGVQEMSLSFLPKMLVVFVTILFAGPWLMGAAVDFTTLVIQEIPARIGF
jgi:flagellar biosynthetic protein FliQ